MSELMIGTSALDGADLNLMRQAGIGWVRQSFRFPFEDRIGGKVSGDYLKCKAAALKLRAAGMSVMGTTPLPGIGTLRPDADGKMVLTWQNRLPEWCGPLGSEQFLTNYEAACAWLASDLKGLVPAWQIANELDIEQFAGPLDPRQACDLVTRAARGLKHADPGLIVGHNPAGVSPQTPFFFGYLYGRGDGLLDYCGIDGYYGTWIAGSPQSWAARVAELHRLTGKPILINEWGFSSAGGLMNEEEVHSGRHVCQFRKWQFSWGAGHTPQGQAAFVRETLWALMEHRSALLGMFFYRWEDQEKCWQCGAPDCPAETAWGLVDKQGRPKPALKAFKDGVWSLQAQGSVKWQTGGDVVEFPELGSMPISVNKEKENR